MTTFVCTPEDRGLLPEPWVVGPTVYETGTLSNPAPWPFILMDAEARAVGLRPGQSAAARQAAFDYLYPIYAKQRGASPSPLGAYAVPAGIDETYLYARDADRQKVDDHWGKVISELDADAAMVVLADDYGQLKAPGDDETPVDAQPETDRTKAKLLCASRVSKLTGKPWGVVMRDRQRVRVGKTWLPVVLGRCLTKSERECILGPLREADVKPDYVYLWHNDRYIVGEYSVNPPRDVLAIPGGLEAIRREFASECFEPLGLEPDWVLDRELLLAASAARRRRFAAEIVAALIETP